MNILYIRQSKESNDAEGSLQGQEQECIYHASCGEHPFEFDLVLRDTVSGQYAIGERQAGKQLLDHIRTGHVTSITMPSVDRLSRDNWGEEDLLAVIKLLTLHDNGTLWYFADDNNLDDSMKPFDYTDEVQVLNVKTKLNASALERISITRRTMRKKHAMLRDGKPVLTGKYAPFGYAYTKSIEGNKVVRTRVIDTPRAQVVKQIFDLYTVSRITVKDIVKVLSEEQALTPVDTQEYFDRHEQEYKPIVWNATKVYKILNNKTYAGFYIWGKHKTSKKEGSATLREEGDHGYFEIPAEDQMIIELEQYTKAQALTKENRVVRSKLDWMLRGHLVCQCGEHYVGNGTYYRCASSKRGNDKCGNPTVRKDDIEGRIWKAVEYIVTEPQHLHTVIWDSLEEGSTQNAERQAQAEETVKAIAGKARELDNLAYSISKAEGTRELDALTNRMRITEQEYSALEAELQTQQSGIVDIDAEELNNVVSQMVFEATQEFDGLDYAGKRNVLDRFGFTFVMQKDSKIKARVSISGVS